MPVSNFYVFIVGIVDPVDIEHILKTCLEKDDIYKFIRMGIGYGSFAAPGKYIYNFIDNSISIWIPVPVLEVSTGLWCLINKTFGTIVLKNLQNNIGTQRRNKS